MVLVNVVTGPEPLPRIPFSFTGVVKGVRGWEKVRYQYLVVLDRAVSPAGRGGKTRWKLKRGIGSEGSGRATKGPRAVET